MTNEQLYEVQTEAVEEVVGTLTLATEALDQTMDLNAPANWDIDRWLKAIDDLETALNRWHRTYDKWVEESQ